MGILFSGSELIDIAIGIETSGEAFYGSLAQSSGNEEARKIYHELAVMERQHKTLFEGMRASVGEYHPDTTYAEDYSLYLKALVDSSVFTDDTTARRMAEEVQSDTQAIQIAMGAEKDSILFYSEMRKFVPKAHFQLLDTVIEEEHKHLRNLAAFKKRLSSD